MLKFQPKCKVCVAVKDNERLLNEIFRSKFFIRGGDGYSLAQLADKYEAKFSYDSLKNHVKKHQFLSEKQFTEQSLQAAAKKASQQIAVRAVESSQVFETIMSQGMNALEDGDMELTANHLLKAAELKKTFQLKEQDQQISMMAMVAHFASGENDAGRSKAYDRRIIENEAVTDFDPTLDSPEDSDRRSAQASTFYQSLAGDAAAPGAN